MKSNTINIISPRRYWLFRYVLACVVLLSSSTACLSQGISGARAVCIGGTYTYTENFPGSVEVYGGTVVSSTNSSVTVRWGSNPSAWLLYKYYRPDKDSDWIEVSFTPQLLSGGTLSIGPSQYLTGGNASLQSSTSGESAGLAGSSSIEFKCVGEAAGQVTLTGHAGTILRWESSTDLVNWQTINHTATTYQLVGVRQTTHYRVVINGGSYCGLYYSSIATLRLFPAPPAPVASPVSRCGPGSVVFQASGADAASFRWYDSRNYLVSTGATFTTPHLNVTSDFYVTSVNTSGCESPKTKVTATLLSLPGAPSSDVVSSVQSCGFTMLAKPLASGQWYWQSSAEGTSTADNAHQYYVVNSGITYLRTRDLNTGCWGGSLAIPVQVKPIPQPPALSSISVIEQCREVSLSAPFSLPQPHYYETSFWQMDPNSTVEQYGSILTVSKPGTYYAKTKNSEGCWSAGSTAYTVSALPETVSCLQGQNINYVVTNVIQKEGIKHESSIGQLTVNDLSQVVEYADGFGRAIEQVIPQGSVSKKDVVVVKRYDQYGRERMKYLPYTENGSGKFRANALSTLASFYQPAQADVDNRASTATPWSESVYEPSPLTRIKEQGSAGEAWQIGSGRTVRYNVRANQANEVRLWEYNYSTGQCVSPGYYGAGELQVEEVTDEEGNIRWDYTDKRGLLVLSKKSVSETAQASTCYVYDNLSRLRMVIQPEGVKEQSASGRWSTDAAFTDKWCFVYHYDKRGRVTEKKVPGAAAVYFVYNKRDQQILSQDGEQRKKNEWSFTKYDALMRVVMSGVYRHSSAASQSALQQLADGHALQFEDRTPDNYLSQYGYTVNKSFPVLTPSGGQIYQVNYYDDYNFDSDRSTVDASYINSGMSPEPVVSQETINKLTGVRVAKLGSAAMLLTVNFYDKRGNVIQQQQQNHLGGRDVETSRYDFTGKVLESRHVHQTQYANVSIRKAFGYDHAGRLLQVKHQVNGGTEVTLAAYRYNELGQQTGKKLHSVTGDNFLQHVDLRYNIRGWLSKINDRNLSEASDLFGMELLYNDGTGLSNARRYYNGNLSEMIFNDRILNKPRGYSFDYDKLGRLSSAQYRTASGAEMGYYNEEGITYDLNGNIKSMLRNHGPARSHDLRYSYSGNTLLAAENTASGTTGMSGYAYDPNGNMISDRSRWIDTIRYNHLNLVHRVQVKDKGTINYTYDALGTRLTKTVIDSAGVATVRNYVGGFEYDKDNKLEFVATEEGRVVLKNANAEYQYHLKDHLGNVRVVFTSVPATQVATATLESAAAVKEESEFPNLDEAVKVNHALFDHTGNATTQYATRLNGTSRERTGLAKSLSVLSGDVVKMEVFAKYIDADRSQWTAALTSLLTSIAGGTAPSGTVVDGGASGSTGNNTFPFGGMIDKGTSTGAGPKAYLNYIVFDRNYKFLDGGFVKLTEKARETGTDVAHERLYKELVITEPGYVYIYLSNENETPVEVYFDDFTVQHVQSLPIQTNDYYPFGLTFNAFDRENSTPNQYKFQGQEHIDDLGLAWDVFQWRNHQPEIGRFFNIDPLAEKYMHNSPYAFSENHVIAHRELEGLEKVLAIYYHGGPFGGGKQTTPEKSHTTGVIFNATQSYAKSIGREFTGTVIAPGWTSESGVETGLNFVNSNYTKGDQVVIYGYSYGVDVAVDLATKLKDAGVAVNTLVTIDGADGPLHNLTVNTAIPDNVGNNLNIYQTTDSGVHPYPGFALSSIASNESQSSEPVNNASNSASGSSFVPGSNGGPNSPAEGNQNSVIINKNATRPGVTHGNIQQKEQSTIQEHINERIRVYK